MQLLKIDQTLINVLAKSTKDGLAMAGVVPDPVGISKYITTTREISAIVGLVGATTGAIMVNASTKTACYLASKMLGEAFTDICPEVLDGISEIANIIAGQSKASLSTTEWKADRISCPSVVVGSSYFITHYKGMHTASVDFEIADMPVNTHTDKVFSVTISLMKI
ncbi:MAG: chemotaxis protein CheX [Planctomycetota bacterium]|jgi:CheY-specific phosphatase CheX